MPKDKAGKFHLNVQRAMGADRMAGGDGKRPAPPMGAPKPMSEHDGAEGEPTMTIHRNADGTHHSITAEGERTEHPHPGHLAAHVAHHHMPEAVHVHHSHDGVEHKMHHVGHDGEIAAHDPQNLEEAKNSLDQFFSEEGHEGGQPADGGGGY